MRALALLCLLSAAVLSTASPVPDKDGYILVPGGWLIHQSCKYSVPDGYVVDGPVNETMLINHETGHVISHPPCAFPARQTKQHRGVYDIDTDITFTELMATFNATFTVPGNPVKQNAGQILYFWPGFKSTSATPGLPVIQPVLEYSYGWSFASWYVYGNVGIAYESTIVTTTAGDTLFGSMVHDIPKKQWIIFTQSKSSGRGTTLTVAESKMEWSDFYVALLCFETYFTEDDCNLYSDKPASIVFDNMIVNNKYDNAALKPKWVQRTGQNQCDQASSIDANGVVTFTWNPHK